MKLNKKIVKSLNEILLNLYNKNGETIFSSFPIEWINEQIEENFEFHLVDENGKHARICLWGHCGFLTFFLMDDVSGEIIENVQFNIDWTVVETNPNLFDIKMQFV